MKYKIPDKNYIKISLDRLTRFKPVIERYERVVDDILHKFLISSADDKISNLALEEKINLSSEIFNSALNKKTDLSLNEIIKKDEEKIFYLTETEKKYLNSKIDFEAALDLFETDELPLNLQRLKLQKNLDSDETRKKYSTLYPVKKAVLTEGITEETLLIEFAKILGVDFKKEGIFVLGAGGKNQVARKYYKMIEEIKIPVFILLANAAAEICELIKPKLSKIDSLYKIKSGEFEDILPKNLIKNALNFHFSQNLLSNGDDFEESNHTVENLNNCYKNNGWGEFKKADFAKIVREYILSAKNPPVSDELIKITEEIKTL